MDMDFGKNMRIGVVGIGFVGLPLAAAFAKMGNTVWCLDTDPRKIEGLKQGIVPIKEPGLDDLVLDGLRHKRLNFTTSYEDTLGNCDILFIAVGTPPGKGGEADLKFVKSVARTIGKKMTRPIIVADKSTVPVGTARMVQGIIQKELTKRLKKIDFWVISNPEFMAEGRAVEDMMNPSRVVVGSESAEVRSKVHLLYKPFMVSGDRFQPMGVYAAELTKYASNAMLALKISFINTIAMLCDILGSDVREVAGGMGSDPRIGSKFLHASLGYGGSCFPKDVKAIIAFAKKIGVPKPYLKLLESIEDVNNFQKTVLARKIVARFGARLSGKKFALWGLAFKAETNDMRESAAIDVVKHLVAHGAKIVAYDPLAVSEAKHFYLKGLPVTYEEQDKYAILDGCDGLIIATETEEYRAIDFERVEKALKKPIIFDGRNLYPIDLIKAAGFEYYAIGRADSLRWKRIKLNLEKKKARVKKVVIRKK